MNMTRCTDPGADEDANARDGDTDPVRDARSQHIIVHNSSSENEDSEGSGDEAVGAAGGYQLLPQEPGAQELKRNGVPDDEHNVPEDDDLRHQGPILSDEMSRMVEASSVSREREEADERAQVWSEKSDSSENTRQASIPLDNGRLETIRSVMAKIDLPKSSVPTWASEMSDDDWQKLVQNKISQSKKQE